MTKCARAGIDRALPGHGTAKGPQPVSPVANDTDTEECSFSRAFHTAGPARRIPASPAERDDVVAVELDEVQGAGRHQLLRGGQRDSRRAADHARSAERLHPADLVGGWAPGPSRSAGHHAAKWAVGGFTEALAQEVAPFGVTVCAIEPGGMRTNWGTRANQDMPELLPDYEPSVGAMARALQPLWGNETSDPARSLRSSSIWPPAIGSPLTFCLAVMPSSMRARPRRPALRMQAAGAR